MVKSLASWGRVALSVVVVAAAVSSAPQKPYSAREKAFYADDATVQFVRPGLVLKITGARIASDGTITATISITDPQGLPLDRTGALTPGAVSISMVAAVLPKSQTEYLAYTTRSQRSTITGNSAIQAAADAGGTFTQVGEGIYEYRFSTRAPTGFDASATHTIGAYGSRDLTLFDLGVNYASATFNFVPDGSDVTQTHDVVRTQACNSCHDQLSAHGGSRRGVEMCVLCHTSQTTDPDTGNTVNLPVMVHKIHMGSRLPSVIAGKPYQIIGFNQSVNDYSTVVFPANVQRCESCHDQNSGAAQATAYLTKPTRSTCGACHDDVNFATGEKHAGGPQFSDNLCATCHIPQGEIDFDASIKGAHVVPAESSLLTGLVVKIDQVTGVAGSAPVVNFSVQDNSGNPLPLSKLGALSFTLAGPTTDYGLTNFGAATPGYATESALAAANCGASGSCIYTFQRTIPAQATGTFALAVEARRAETLLPGTTTERNVQYGAKNQVVYFSVDGSPVVPRRAVVATEKCNGCHAALSIHGTLRNQTEYCVLCHNPANTDAARRPTATVEEDRTAPPQGINFNLLVHRIHTGENLPPERPYIVVGFGGSHNDFSEIHYPALSPTGAAGDTRSCQMCHINSSEQDLTRASIPVTDPQGPINPVQPVTSACTGCHLSLPAASHALGNTTQLGESCAVCHGPGRDFSVAKEHAQY
jgi:OmcA/MtrC family decaheme c-type cytochrome